ncbi:MAG: hypothetical protein Q8Q09_23030 [Deltaproteobacteria bacterium]|nr:hypothetical protein [Deltaproteobacteria bacterium]
MISWVVLSDGVHFSLAVSFAFALALSTMPTPGWAQTQSAQGPVAQVSFGTPMIELPHLRITDPTDPTDPTDEEGEAQGNPSTRAPAPCEPSQTQYWDPSSLIFRSCPAALPSAPQPPAAPISQPVSTASPEPPPSSSSHRCQPGQLQYYDPGTQIYRNCTNFGAGEQNSSRSTSRAPNFGGRVCGSGAVSYLETETLIYRPCPADGRAPSAQRLRSRRPSQSPSRGARCAPGQLQYFDPDAQIYRPCR